MKTNITKTPERRIPATISHVETDLREALLHAIGLAADIPPEQDVAIWHHRSDPHLHVGVLPNTQDNDQFVGGDLWLMWVNSWKLKSADTRFFDKAYYEKKILIHYDWINGDYQILEMGKRLVRAGIEYKEVKMPYRAISEFTPGEKAAWEWAKRRDPIPPKFTTGGIRRNVICAIDSVVDLPSTHSVILWHAPQTDYLRSNSTQEIRNLLFNGVVIEPLATVQGWNSFLSSSLTEEKMIDAVERHFNDVNGDQIVAEIAKRLIEKGMIVEDREENDDDLPF